MIKFKVNLPSKFPLHFGPKAQPEIRPNVGSRRPWPKSPKPETPTLKRKP